MRSLINILIESICYTRLIIIGVYLKELKSYKKFVFFLHEFTIYCIKFYNYIQITINNVCFTDKINILTSLYIYVIIMTL